MTISVGELFDKAELLPAGVVQWDEPLKLDLPGVYVVASTPDFRDPIGGMDTYRPSPSAFESLRSRCPSVTVDGAPATNEKLAERIGAFWIPETAVLYIGLAGSSVRKRVNQYYNTPIGHRSPHAGGWWLKTLADIEALHVHYAATESPKLAEARLLNIFAAAVPPSVRRAVHDPDRIAPFANVEVQAGIRKRHGMAGDKLERAAAKTVVGPSASEQGTLARAPHAEVRIADKSAIPGKSTRVESQVISENDRKGNDLRVPARSKFAFPAVDGHLDVKWQGQTIRARWRVNGSRSGTIGLGRAVMRSIGTRNSSIWMLVNGASVVMDD
jgi:hypothetical protein